MNGVTKETFRAYPVENKLDTIFDYIEAIHGTLDCRKDKCDERAVECDKRIGKIEKNQTKYKAASVAIAGGGGFLGGFTAMMLKLQFWK